MRQIPMDEKRIGKLQEMVVKLPEMLEKKLRSIPEKQLLPLKMQLILES